MAGRVSAASIENAEISPPVVTPVRICSFKKSVLKKNRYFWDAFLRATCPWCGKRFTISENILELIKTSNPDRDLSPNKSICPGLQSGEREDPRLLSECPLCQKPLRFNPFLVDNRNRI
jgi:hypothetical protein